MSEHISVLLNEVLEFLQPTDRKIYFDGTFGGGGYTRAILSRANCSVVACDRDAFVTPFAEDISEKFQGRFLFSHDKFSNIQDILRNHNIDKVDGIVLDLGLSNFQLEDDTRGFSFKSSGAIDMSMGLCDENALDVIRRCSEQTLANIIYEFGEERFSRRIAKNIKLNLKNLHSATDLANAVRAVVPKKGKIDPATKTFQALRIFVNHELDELKNLLESSVNLLNPEGRIVIVSFHSLEDRIVKFFFKDLANQGFKILTKKPVVPSEGEIQLNPKSRSAKLRCIVKE